MAARLLVKPKYHRVTEPLLRQWLPRRPREAHKGDFGRLLLLCGATGYTGAPVLAARAAVRTGAGLVFAGVPEAVYPIVAGALLEPMVVPLPCENGMLSAAAVVEILRRLSSCDACLVGCGLGRSEGTLAVVRAVLEQAACPVVVDADGINVLSGHIDVLRGAACPGGADAPRRGIPAFGRRPGAIPPPGSGLPAFPSDRRDGAVKRASDPDLRPRRYVPQRLRQSGHGDRRQWRRAGRDSGVPSGARLAAHAGGCCGRLAPWDGGRPLRGTDGGGWPVALGSVGGAAATFEIGGDRPCGEE